MTGAKKGVIIGRAIGATAGDGSLLPRKRTGGVLDRNLLKKRSSKRGMQLPHFRFLLTVAALALPLASTGAEGVKVANAWVRAPVPGQPTAAAYLDVTSDRNLAMVAAGSPAAGRVEMHSMTVDGGVMRMRALPRIDLPAGQTVKLTPGGTHLMMLDLKQPMKPGDTVPLVLSLQPTGAGQSSLTTVTVQAEVRAGAPAQHQH
jgi:copper(I)-binding protein